ncbi:MAG: hypothetical protein DI536_17975 [Archangium gephyra]|uniref:DNA-binding response regulator n=1 Tax=Archangium gephyra TaxID=48 RepID=A0A2W5T688_9BACT|nr:MAG: hypothetical protein DI536_17975 [Archangium gephyra]
MNRLRALVLEDEWPARNYLVELIHGSGLAQVVGAVATEAEAREALLPSSGLAVDVAFIDVQLARGGDAAGLDVARAAAATNADVQVVLATAFEQHALEAFKLGAVDYLLKPFSEERVTQCLTRIQQRRAPRAPNFTDRIVARRKKSLVFLEPKEIWAFEAAERLTFVHTKLGRFDMDLSLSSIEQSLGAVVTRVHRNWLVNASHIKELSRDDAETSLFVGETLTEGGIGVRVPVARDRSHEVREMLLENATGLRR